MQIDLPILTQRGKAGVCGDPVRQVKFRQDSELTSLSCSLTNEVYSASEVILGPEGLEGHVSDTEIIIWLSCIFHF